MAVTLGRAQLEPHRLIAAERGQGLVEYGLILGGIAIVAIVTLIFFGDVVAQVLDWIGNLIDRATT